MVPVMVIRPAHVNRYEFVAVCALRAQQLLAGCIPRLEGEHSATTMAQMEVVAGRVTRTTGEDTGRKQCGWQR
jgi:DNA-directed RNA polymerase subunit K/omega